MPELDGPLLSEKLTLEDQLSLGSLAQHPGYKILEALIHAEVDRVNEDIKNLVKLSPKDPNYISILTATHQEARFTNKFAKDILKSIAYHVKVGTVKTETEEESLLRRIREAV